MTRQTEQNPLQVAPTTFPVVFVVVAGRRNEFLAAAHDLLRGGEQQEQPQLRRPQDFVQGRQQGHDGDRQPGAGPGQVHRGLLHRHKGECSPPGTWHWSKRHVVHVSNFHGNGAARTLTEHSSSILETCDMPFLFKAILLRSFGVFGHHHRRQKKGKCQFQFDFVSGREMKLGRCGIGKKIDAPNSGGIFMRCVQCC